jgi:hypothetical protein
MGLKEFWDKLTGGDAAEEEIEEIRDNPDEVPHKVEDYEGMKDDRWVDQRYPGTERLSDDHL